MAVVSFTLQPPAHRSLGLVDWKKENPSLPESKFNNHWRNKVSSDKKDVHRVPLLVSSYLTSDVLDQEYALRAIELVRCHHAHRLSSCLSNIAVLQSRN